MLVQLISVSFFRRFYKDQNELITAFEEIDLEVDDAMENALEQTQLNKASRILAKVSFFLNLVSYRLTVKVLWIDL